MRAPLLFVALALAVPQAHANELDDRLARLAHLFDDVRLDFGVSDHVVRWQKSMRDFVHQTAETLARVAQKTQLPDVSILTALPIANGRSSGFGWRDDPIRHRAKFHSGTDFKGKHGMPVVAAGPGVVVFAGRRGGYGNMIEIDHGGGVVTRYAHLRRILAKRDTAVVAGQRIGQVGSTGRATGPHLHFEVRLANSPVDPVTAMSVAELVREAPAIGRIAACALAPEIQSEVASSVDPPKRGRHAKKGSRPERRGRVRRVKPVS